MDSPGFRCKFTRGGNNYDVQSTMVTLARAVAPPGPKPRTRGTLPASAEQVEDLLLDRLGAARLCLLQLLLRPRGGDNCYTFEALYGPRVVLSKTSALFLEVCMRIGYYVRGR